MISFDLVDPDGQVIHHWDDPIASGTREIVEGSNVSVETTYNLRVPPLDVTFIAAAIHIKISGLHITTVPLVPWRLCPPLPLGAVYIFNQSVVIS